MVNKQSVSIKIFKDFFPVRLALNAQEPILIYNLEIKLNNLNTFETLLLSN